MNNTRVVGQSVPRPDAYDKVTGGKGYPVNVALRGMLHAKLLRSPYPHARVRNIDTSKAETYPGVKSVLTAKDVPQRPFSPVYFSPLQAQSMVQDLVIMTDTVRYAGQPVAAVAASSVEIAEQALNLIDVDYEELPAVFDPTDAMQAGAPQLHPGASDNIAKTERFEFGDIDAGFAEADHIFEATFQTQRAHTCYMEPRVCVVDTDQRGNVVVHSSMQHIFGLREKLAYTLDIPESKVRVVKPDYIGGGFGGKLDIGYIEPVAALLSMKARKPVRIEQTRYEDFITTTRNPIRVALKTGVKKDGTFTARYAKSILDCGAHATHGAAVIMVHGIVGILSTYHCANQTWEGHAVYTNNIIGGGYRGYGGPQGAFAVETQIDEICEALNLDPIEFRRKNCHQQGAPHPFVQGVNLNTYRFEQCLQDGGEKIEWSNRHGPGFDNGVKKRGLGLACQPFWPSGCLGFPDIYEHSGAIVKLNRDGSADLSTACVDLGSGQSTVLCQIAAEELGLDMEKVQITYADTDTVPFDAPVHASRATYSAGNAVKAVALSAKQRLVEVAAVLLEAQVEDLEVGEGKVYVQGSADAGVSIEEVVTRAESPFLQMTDQGPKPTTIAEKGTIIGMSSMAPPSNPSPASVQFVEVEVDTETGQVDVQRVVFAHDIGKVVHPHGAEGQVEGGFQQGMGYALMEHLAFDEESGACVASDFLDYKIPTAVEMPSEIDCLFIESDEPTGPFGAKSLSEPCVVVPAPAIANAIYNACGARVRELPITPEKILKALGKI